MSKLTGGNHIVLTVKDLKNSVAWYKQVLGWLGYKLSFESDEHVYFKFGEPEQHVAIFQGKSEFDGDTFNRYRVGFHHLALGVTSRDIVDGLYKFLQDQSIPVIEPPVFFPDYGENYYAMFLHDPDGLRLEVYSE